MAIPHGYPHGCSEDDIRQVIADTSDSLAGLNVNDVLRLSPVITIGQSELDARRAQRLIDEVATLKSITETATTSADQTSRRSLKLGYAALGVALFSTIVQLVR